jgi:hypothetical protein
MIFSARKYFYVFSDRSTTLTDEMKYEVCSSMVSSDRKSLLYIHKLLSNNTDTYCYFSIAPFTLLCPHLVLCVHCRPFVHTPSLIISVFRDRAGLGLGLGGLGPLESQAQPSLEGRVGLGSGPAKAPACGWPRPSSFVCGIRLIMTNSVLYHTPKPTSSLYVSH